MLVAWPRIFAPTLALAACFALPAGAAKIIEYQIPTSNSHPHGITLGPDGRLWFAEAYGPKLGAVTTDGAFTEHLVVDSSLPRWIVPVPGSLLAFTKSNGAGLGFSTLAGTNNEFPAYVFPWGLVFGTDGRLWIADTQASKVTAFHWRANAPDTKEFPLSSPGSFVANGPDGNIWVTEEIGAKIASCNPDGNSCTEYPLPAGSYPEMITAGPDGNLWFAEFAGRIGRMTTSGGLTEFPLPVDSYPFGICAGPDGNIWFTEVEVGKIGRITKTGVITEYAVPTAGSEPYGITAGPDGNIWFTERKGNKIGKLQVFIPGDVNDDGSVDVSDVFYLINFLFAGGPAPK